MLHKDRMTLVVVDFQDRLLPKIPVAGKVLAKAARLIEFAKLLDIPIVLTEQYPKGLGPTAASLRDALPDIEPVEKVSFGCFGDAGFRRALAATGRGQVLLTGVETHVCIMQTALGGLDEGYDVYVPRDAVASREKDQYKAGLARMRAAGVNEVTVEMAMFEALREAGTTAFKSVLPLIK